jgi:eukaryotic-like serine/threonine-protein kinase
VKEIFHQALVQPRAERDAYIAARTQGEPTLAAEVNSLLSAHDESSGFLGQPAVDLRPALMNYAGQKIGHYVVERQLGEGGMGAVYLARREMDGFAMPVAIKLIRWAAFSESVERRFRMERQILARLHHPNIPLLVDGGVTPEGLPYLVTEYVEGQPLDGYHPLGLRARLDLFLEICSAVAEAHRNLIVHGDLKPSNVLVTPEGNVKLLDFGISRLLVDEEQAAQNATVPAMTPAWASPEQLRGELPLIASDCYSLGRLLYYLLTGAPAVNPTGRTPLQVLEGLTVAAPVLPSKAASDPELAGDLDNIALKALECSPDDRYRSVELLADDIRSFLESRPVSARPHTWRYRTHKFVGRNKGVVAAVALVTVTLSGGLAATMWQARIAERNYERAERRFADVRRLANSFLFEMDEAIAKLPGSTPVRGTLVRNAVQYLDGLAAEAAGDSTLQEELAAAYEKVGDIQGRPASANLGDTGGALVSYRKALAIREALEQMPGTEEDQRRRRGALAATYVQLSSTLKAAGDYRSGLELDRKALAMRQKLLDAEPGNPARRRAVAASFTAVGGSLSQLGAWPAVIDVRRQAIEQYEALVAGNPKSEPDQRGLALARQRMGSILIHERQYPLALKQYRMGVATARGIVARNPGNRGDLLNLGQGLMGLGRCLVESGDAAAGAAELAEAQKIFERMEQADPREVRGRTLLALSRALAARAALAMGKPEEALRGGQRALAEREKLSAENPVNAGAFGEVAEAHELMGDVRAAQRRWDAAELEWRRAREMIVHLRNENKFNAADREALERIEAKLAALAKAPR